MLDGHMEPVVLSVAHIRKPTVTADRPHMYKFWLENVRGGYDATSFTYFGKEP